MGWADGKINGAVGRLLVFRRRAGQVARLSKKPAKSLEESANSAPTCLLACARLTGRSYGFPALENLKISGRFVMGYEYRLVLHVCKINNTIK